MRFGACIEVAGIWCESYERELFFPRKTRKLKLKSRNEDAEIILLHFCDFPIISALSVGKKR